MERGIALQFKNKYPENFRAYQQACKQGILKPGKCLFLKQGSLYHQNGLLIFPLNVIGAGKVGLKTLKAG